MSNITICQGCYRIFSYDSSVSLDIWIDQKPVAVDCCLQCAGNLATIPKITPLIMNNYSAACSQVIKFLDPIAIDEHKVSPCYGCRMPTTNTRCFECSWKTIREAGGSWLVSRISRYVDFDKMFEEKSVGKMSYIRVNSGSELSGKSLPQV